MRRQSGEEIGSAKVRDARLAKSSHPPLTMIKDWNPVKCSLAVHNPIKLLTDISQKGAFLFTFAPRGAVIGVGECRRDCCDTPAPVSPPQSQPLGSLGNGGCVFVCLHSHL